MYPTRTPITNANLNAYLAMASKLDDEVVSGKPVPKKFRNSAIVDAMAEAMRERGEGCTDKDLRRAGFSQTEIDAHGEKASDRAGLKARLN